MPKVTIVIPCFNQGAFLAESVGSVLSQTLQDFEIVVVNDGSTDADTVRILTSFHAPKTRIVHTENLGVSAARNLGISLAGGEYILPLDCDDRIAPTYLAKAAAHLDADPLLGIVYCRAEFFGFQSGLWALPTYRFPECILEPAIFCTAMFRRVDWQATGGYSSELKHGFEDHDFWLGLVKRGRKVHCINETLFYYRRLPNSVTHALTYEKHVGAFMTIFQHHRELFVDNMEVLIRGYLAREAEAHARSNSPIIQVFADTGTGYNEFDSVRTRYAAGNWVVVTMPLPKRASTRRMPLRLDPGMQAGCYDISEIELLHDNRVVATLCFDGSFTDTQVKVEGTALFLPTPEGLRLLSFGSDPQIILSGLSLPDEANTLQVKLRYQPEIEAAADSLNLLKRYVETPSLTAVNIEAAL